MKFEMFLSKVVADWSIIIHSKRFTDVEAGCADVALDIAGHQLVTQRGVLCEVLKVM
jgi:hypothetical protein